MTCPVHPSQSRSSRRGRSPAACCVLAGRLRQIGIFVALIAIVILFQVLTGGILLTPRNVTNIINQNAYILILAIGMVMIIIAGHIDLSVGSVVAFIGADHRRLHRQLGVPWWLGVLACAPGRRPDRAPGRASGWPTSASRRSSSRSPAC